MLVPVPFVVSGPMGHGFVPAGPWMALQPGVCAVPYAAAYPPQLVPWMPTIAQPCASSSGQAAEACKGSATSSAASAGANKGPARSEEELLPVLGNVWRLSRQYHGCRRVQDALEGAGSEAERQEIAAELRGRVWHAALCPNANHVVQKCITTMKAESVQFIIDELTYRGPGATCKAARNQYGCRVLQRLLEHCLEQQLVGLVNDVLTEQSRLCTHIYGNYVMQHVLEHGSASQKSRVAAHIQGRVRELCADDRACAVLAKALLHASRDDRKAIARAILQEEGLIGTLAGTRHGHVATEQIVRLLKGEELEDVRCQLERAHPPLHHSRFGRVVLTCLQQRLSDLAARAAAAGGGGGVALADAGVAPAELPSAPASVR